MTQDTIVQEAFGELPSNTGSDINSVLDERHKSHGPFDRQAMISQYLKAMVINNDKRLTDVQREALDMILHKVARILAGNPNVDDHWIDIAGYANLPLRFK